MTLEQYTVEILASKDILGVNTFRDKAMVDRDLAKGEFVALVKIISARKKEILNLNTIKQ